ncbi:MAG: hypothetical protein ACE362_11350 [Phaeodactylibacter xiamenensis]|uniref:Uncharacterized protein n=1 Tax=Phaeodactylibacter xiamenensis TaxID=1524460 RepID=A0A098S3H1_9BACT|nr:hypothetical protein [Phaeodactylibacter xiamenensis]KGE86889.1 hypothetical protein IX84_17685 [Phaeodactylibacter xiamenensis]MCR9053203.1 hypothetical protein [bacterium]
MPVALPGPAVSVPRSFLMLLTTAFTDKNPGALLLKLHPVQRSFLPITGITDLCFHIYSSPRQDLCKVDAGIFFARKAKNAGIRTDGEAFQRSERKKEQVKMH